MSRKKDPPRRRANPSPCHIKPLGLPPCYGGHPALPHVLLFSYVTPIPSGQPLAVSSLYYSDTHQHINGIIAQLRPASVLSLVKARLMAVAHAFHHDSRGIRPALENATTTASVFLGEHDAGAVRRQAAAVAVAVAGHTAFSDPRSELTCNNTYDATRSVVPSKRSLIGDAVGASLIMEGHRALLPVPQPFGPAEDAQGSRVLICSGAASTSTSGRPVAGSAPVSQHGILAHLYRHSVEIDALVRIEIERLRAVLEDARRRHVRAVVSAVERAAARRLRAAEADLERALARNAELDERVREMGAEGQAWQGIASGHEAAAADLRATLEQLLHQTPCAGAGAGAAADEGQGEVEDARSCCFEPGRAVDNMARGTRACRACGAADACVLLLPCRHLCLCGGCEAVVEVCPVCAATKNASLHVLLS